MRQRSSSASSRGRNAARAERAVGIRRTLRLAKNHMGNLLAMAVRDTMEATGPWRADRTLGPIQAGERFAGCEAYRPTLFRFMWLAANLAVRIVQVRQIRCE